MSALAGITRRVLVVDDDRALHEAFREGLCPPGSAVPERLEVDSAFQEQEGLERVRVAVREGRPYAVAFVGLHLASGPGGEETAARLWEEAPDLQLVLCTARANGSLEQVARLGGRQGLFILRKPFEAFEARQLARALVERWELLRRNHRQQEELEAAQMQLRKEVEERMRLEKRLGQAHRLESLGRVSTGLPHEINNPLSVIMACLGLLRAEFEAKAAGQRSMLEDPEELKEVCLDALTGAERIRRIINDIRLFSQLHGQPRARVDVREALEHALSSVELKPEVRVVRDFQDVPPVWGSVLGLEQVFLALLTNAAQALRGSGSEPSLRVSTCLREDGWVGVEVQDNGNGIAPEHLHRIFDPFFTTRPVGAGSGLGLSICQGIVSELGGNISVDSKPGQGATFRVLLPRAPAESGAVVPSPATG